VFRDEIICLERLLRQGASCYDDLVVVHDGLEDVEQRAHQGSSSPNTVAGSSFCPRSFQQEPQLAFRLEQARHAWILRLDADEVPSTELKNWLQAFRVGPGTY